MEILQFYSHVIVDPGVYLLQAILGMLRCVPLGCKSPRGHGADSEASRSVSKGLQRENP